MHFIGGIAFLIELGFLLFFGTLLYLAVRGISRWSYNNAQPILSVPATVIAKRTATSGGGNDISVSTSYYIAFEMAGGERMEFGLRGSEYGLQTEGDQGVLTHQGTRYKSFQRQTR